METISINLYEFNELSDRAKEKAREWWRSIGLDYEWWDSTYEDANTVGIELTGFDLDRNRHAAGKFSKDAHEVAGLIIENHGQDCETRKTAEAFLKEHDEAVESAPRDENGEIESEYQLDQKLDDIESDFLKSILEDYSMMLQKEYEYLLSDESVCENILCNGYTFTAGGKRMS